MFSIDAHTGRLATDSAERQFCASAVVEGEGGRVEGEEIGRERLFGVAG